MENFQQPSAIIEAARWLQALLTGTLVVTIATIALALVGFAMLQGRVALRRALQIVLGCFIVFGSSAIAQGISNSARGLGAPIQSAPSVTQPPVLPSAAPQFDPYAGASTPQ